MTPDNDDPRTFHEKLADIADLEARRPDWQRGMLEEVRRSTCTTPRTLMTEDTAEEHDLIMRFDDPESRRWFILMMESNSWTRERIDEQFYEHHLEKENHDFDLSKALDSAGWDGQGLPMIKVISTPNSDEEGVGIIND